MSEYNNLSDEDVQRIARGIVYTIPARLNDGRQFCIGSYGDLSHKVNSCIVSEHNHSSAISLNLKDASAYIHLTICRLIDEILDGKSGDSQTWSLIDGAPYNVSPKSESAV